MPQGILTAGQKVSRGVLGYVVGKASEALHAERRSQQIGPSRETVTEGRTRGEASRTLNLESDKRLNIQLRLDFSSAPTGEARQALREDIESLSVVHESERPANTSRII